MSISPPVKITVPFATSGTKAAIPAAASNPTGRAGYDLGFPPSTFIPKVAGGIPPWGEDFNGIFFEITQALQFLEAGGSFPFDSAWATAVGGYPVGALVSRSDNSGLWRNTVANNTTNPESGGAGWQPEDAGATSITMTNANVTLTALQAARPIIIITGTLTANLQLIFPPYQKTWVVVNNCTGSFTITAKTASGSGTPISTSSFQYICGDGVNIGASSNGRLVNVQRFGAPGTFSFSPTPGTGPVMVVASGAGGSGAGTPVTGAGQCAVGGPGGSGAYVEAFFPNGIPSGTSITVGTGGAPVNGGGTNGGATTVGAFISCPGGRFGTTAGPSAPPLVTGGGSGATATATVSGGILIQATGGNSAGLSFALGLGSTSIGGSPGANGQWGGGGAVTPGNTPGNSASAPGAGGAGVATNASQASIAGGRGGDGCVVFYEFARF